MRRVRWRSMGNPRQDGRARLILTLAVALLGLPFVNQAFHIDDRIYLEVAENALRSPLFPYDYPAVFEGIRASDAASHSHLPLTSYYLAALRLLFGTDREWVFHLAFLVFPLAAVWAFYDLAARWLRHPLPAALLLAVSPGFVVLGHTLMTEVPLLAFWLLAVSRFPALLAGAGRGRDWGLMMVGILGAAWISLLAAALMLLLGAVWLVHRFGRRGLAGEGGVRPAALAAALFSPLLVWAFWYGIGYLHYGRFLLMQTAGHMDQRGVLTGGLMAAKALSFLLVLGGAVFFPLAVWWGLGRRRSAGLFAAVGILSGLGLGFWADGWSAEASLLFGLFLAAGGLAVWGFFREWLTLWRSSGGGPGDGLSDAEKCLPLLWFTGIFASCILLYPSGSVRYALLAFPPLILLWQSSLERLLAGNQYLLRNVAWATVALTAVLALAVGHADYRFAGVYPKMARHLVNEYGGSGKTVWFTAEWGFRHYLEKAGARLLARVEVGPKPGDIIIKPRLASPWVTLYDGREHIFLLKQIDAQIDTPLRILDVTSHAGFYSTAWGILPYSVSDGQRWEWFNVFQVKKEYDGPVPEPEKYW